jgi:hypothetical protein
VATLQAGDVFRVSFDIGGVLTRHPEVFRRVVAAFAMIGAEVYVITDMPDVTKAVALVRDNGFNISPAKILCADYAAHGENCKREVIKQHGIHLHFDDYGPYCAHQECVSLLAWPRPDLPYNAPGFKT